MFSLCGKLSGYGTVSVLQSRGMSSSEKHLSSAIAFEVEKGYQNALGRKMRFNTYLFSKITKLCSRSKRKFAEKLLEEADNYDIASISDRSKLLNKVSVLMGFGSLHDLIENEKAPKFMKLKDGVDDCDVSLVCKRFPSIILGSSSVVELYDETKCCSEMRNHLAAQSFKGFLAGSMGAKCVEADGSCDLCPNQYPLLQDENSSLLREEIYDTLPSSLAPLISKTGEKKVLATKVESSAKVALQSPQTSPSVELNLDKSIGCIPGLSKNHHRQLEKCGFHTLRKLLHHFPRTYADLQNAEIGIDDGHYLIFIGKILSSRGIKASYTFSFLEVVVECEINDIGYRTNKTIYLHLKKFFRGTRFTSRPFLRHVEEKHKEGDVVCVTGKVRIMSKRDHYEMREYTIDVLEDEQDLSLRAKKRPYPIYPSKAGINPKLLGDVISRALKAVPVNVDPIPKDIIQDFGLVALRDAYIGIHRPNDLAEADSARKRLIFDEFFYLQLGRLFQMLEGLGTQIEKNGLLEKYRKPELNAVYIDEWSSLAKKFLKALPYSLTSSQLNAVSEIIWDLKRPVPMNRLLQGDVGCGKTVVAFLACMEVVGSGYQAAFMVPTELLAVQHYQYFSNLIKNMDDAQSKPSVALLTGSTPSKESRIVCQGLQTGDISFIIGTHSLISENIEFSSLRIAVVDEQHRFGVIQRGRFNSKLYYTSMSSRLANPDSDGPATGEVYMAPHVLAMSATPIPRTLALALYGDMSLTQITDLPPGRIPVDTFTMEGNEASIENVYKMILDELESGGKVFLVYPVIEQSEQLPQLRAASADFDTVSRRFNDYKCGLLHGKMKSDEKDEALRRFRSGETQILLSTQVIEIGVDIPDASMMVVMNAERFGVAQLHQLRGRVGRGMRKSKCVLLTSTASSLNRLKALEKSSDGFYLANMDLLLRGPGDLLGKKQSGHIPEFPIARLEIDGNILQDAHLAALNILSTSHDLAQFPELKAELSMRQPLCLFGD